MRRCSSASSNSNRRRTVCSRKVRNSPQHRRQVDPQRRGDLFVLRGKEAGEVDVEPGLERRVLVEVRHHQVGIGARLQLQHDADVVGRLVAHVDQQRELLVDDHVGDPLDDARLGERVRDRGDDDVVAGLAARLGLPFAAHPHAPLPRLVDVAQLFLAVGDLTAGRKVGPLDVLEEVLRLQLADRRASRPPPRRPRPGCGAGCWSPCRRRSRCSR